MTKYSIQEKLPEKKNKTLQAEPKTVKHLNMLVQSI